MMRYGFDPHLPRPLRTLCRCGQRASIEVPHIAFGMVYSDFWCEACWQRMVSGDDPSTSDPREIAALIAAYENSRK